MGFLRPKSTPAPTPITKVAPIVAPVKKKIADTTQPGDEGEQDDRAGGRRECLKTPGTVRAGQGGCAMEDAGLSVAVETARSSECERHGRVR